VTISVALIWMGFGELFSMIFALLLVGVPSSVALAGDKISLHFLSRHLFLARCLSLSQSQAWTVLNIALAFLGAWKGFGWHCQSALLIIALIAVPLVTMTAQSIMMQRVQSAR
jgi:hypothetical protein